MLCAVGSWVVRYGTCMLLRCHYSSKSSRLCAYTLTVYTKQSSRWHLRRRSGQCKYAYHYNTDECTRYGGIPGQPNASYAPDYRMICRTFATLGTPHLRQTGKQCEAVQCTGEEICSEQGAHSHIYFTLRLQSDPERVALPARW